MLKKKRPTPKLDHGKIKIKRVGAPYLGRRQEEFEYAIRSAFRNATFHDKKMSHVDVFERSIAERDSFKGEPSLVAEDKDGNIVGAVFHISTDESAFGNYGWFFTAPTLDSTKRRELANKLIRKTHEIMKRVGKEEIVVTIGTREGARFLEDNHGYISGGNSRRPSNNVWGRKL